MKKETLSTSEKEVPKHKNALEEKYQTIQEKEMRLYYREGGSTPAWQRKEGKSPSGGLNKAGRASYKRETGGTLKAPTKSKTSGRRKAFCARMGGMKKRLTSAKTARDPNSRIIKALRKWDC